MGILKSVIAPELDAFIIEFSTACDIFWLDEANTITDLIFYIE